MKPWTAAHRWEAGARLYEIAAEMHRAAFAEGRTECVEGFRLAKVDPLRVGIMRGALRRAGFDSARIDREVRRVRALAEGRLARETSTRITMIHPDGSRGGTWSTMASAREWVGLMSERERASYRPVRVRVTRIRRA